MPDEDKETKHSGQYGEPVYTGDDIPAGPVNIPDDIPQEHMAQSSLASSSPVERAPKSQIFKRFFYLVIFLFVVCILAFAAWKFIPSKTNSNQTSQNGQSSSNTQSADPVKLALGDTGLSKTYSSDNLSLQLKYPESWTVSEQDSSIIIKSPAFDMKDKAGAAASTYFKVYIKKGADETDGKYLGRGFAVAPSEKINYSSPAAGQHTTTFLTDFGLDTNDNFAYFVVQGNFQLSKGDTLGPKYASEPDSYLVTGGFATDKQKDGLETIKLPLDSYKQNLAYQTGVDIVKSLQLQ